jgi:ribonuclease R
LKLPKKPKPVSRLPSESEIISYLAQSPGASGKRDIARAFGVKGQDKTALKVLLRDLERAGKTNRRRKRIEAAGSFVGATLLEVEGIDADGDIFGRPVGWKDGEAPLVLIATQSLPARAPKPGEQILAALTPQDDETYPFRARVIRSFDQNAPRTLGVYREGRAKGEARIVPIDKKSRHDFRVDTRGLAAEDGELVAIDVPRGRGFGLAAARITQKLGNVSDPRNISLLAIHQHGIPDSFPQAVMKEVEGLAPFTPAHRIDLRHIPLITIDPADARDHDDAVWAEADTIENNTNGYRVIVAIADVSHYVRSGTALDREARKRGNSTYFPDRVVPMLPERISNDLCSLKEDQDRPAIACEMIFDATGHKTSHKFTRIIMRSAASLSYEEAQAAIDGRPSTRAKPLLDTVLTPLWAAYRTVSKARDMRSPLELDLPERKIILSKDGHVDKIITPERLDAHRLIEEFMILANVAAAEELEKRKTPLLYRAHDEPSKEKIRALAEFLQTMGKDFALGQVLNTKAFNRLLKSVEGSEFARAVHEIVLRTQSQAIYSPLNVGHFGLALRRYAHFTSPIRRYADLIVHRALITACKLGDDGLSKDDITQLEETATIISTAERRSMLAERETGDRLAASYLAEHQGATFKGRISGVVGAGLFVKLNDTGADGFVPVASLGQDFFEFDQTSHALTGRSTGEMFQIGDSVDVRLLEVAPIKGGLRLEMISEGRTSTAPKKKSPHRGKLVRRR